jgi:hypothetical protein
MYSGLNGKAVTKRLAADAAVMARAGWIVVSQTKTGLVEYTVIYGRQGAPAGAVVVAPQPTPSAGSAAAPQPPSDSAPAFSVADELDKLATLRDRGILTPEEFAERKQRLLAV